MRKTIFLLMTVCICLSGMAYLTFYAVYGAKTPVPPKVEVMRTEKGYTNYSVTAEPSGEKSKYEFECRSENGRIRKVTGDPVLYVKFSRGLADYTVRYRVRSVNSRGLRSHWSKWAELTIRGNIS